MAHKWPVGGETYILDLLNDPANLTELAAPQVWTARTGLDDLIGYGDTEAAAVADYNRARRDRASTRGESA